MKKKMIWLLCCTMLAALLAACGGEKADSSEAAGTPPPASSEATGTPAPASSAVQEQPAETEPPATLSVTVTNVSGYNFQELYVSPTGSDNWGQDHLGSTSILKNNGSYDITIDRYEFANYDVMILDEDGDEYRFMYVPLADGCEISVGFDDNGYPGMVVTGADGAQSMVSGTLNGSGADSGGEVIVVQEEPTSTGTGYDTDGQFAFTVYNNSDYDIYSLHMGILDAGSDHDIDVLPQILPANSSTTITGQASMGDWIQTDWTIYVTDVDGDTSASYDTFNPWTVSYVDIYWQGDSYVCEFTY